MSPSSLRIAGGRPVRGVVLLIMGLAAGAPAAFGQALQVYPREYAAYGPTSGAVHQPALAAGPNMVISVFDSAGEGVCYAKYDPLDQEWVDMGVIPFSFSPAPYGPSITYDARNDTFVAAAHCPTAPGQVGRLVTSRFGLDTGRFEEWVVQRTATTVLIPPFMGPRIVSGDPDLPTGQELYIVCGNETGYRRAYLRSQDSGQTWVYDEIYLYGDPGQPVTWSGPFWATCWEDGPLYAACLEYGYNRIHFLKGTDVGAYVYWEPFFYIPESDSMTEDESTTEETDEGLLLGPDGARELTVQLNTWNVCHYLPGFFPAYWERSTIPNLVADPTNPNRLFVVYHDRFGASDVNVYVRTLTLNPDNGYWSLGGAIKVNNDQTIYQSDQFAPTATVDTSGRISIIFYDDRRYTDGPEGDLQPDSTVNPKFDTFLAWSAVPLIDFEERNELLFGQPPEPALDWAVEPYTDPFYYNGVAVWGDNVWTTYTGTLTGDSGNKSVISSNRGVFVP